MIALRHYQDKKIGVLGLALAGSSTVSALLSGGAEVFAWDDKEESRKNFERHFAEGKVRLLDPKNWPWKELSAMVLSPGIPLTHPVPHPVVTIAQTSGVRITGDIELLCEAQPLAKKIAITGTNGKSTTTSLIGHIIKSAGRRVETGGNLGISALSLMPQGSDGSYVLELSSYQLDLLHTARFNIAMLLNVTPDHLERHGSMDGYVAAKTHIFERQTKHDAALVSIDDNYSRSVYTTLRQVSHARVHAISVQSELKQGVYVDKDGMLHDKLDPQNPLLYNLQDIQTLTGRHNWQNAAFAYTACKLHGLSLREIEKGLKSFPGLRHRLQAVANIHGVRFINDSKATNAEATSHALAPFNHIYWIAGGRAKDGGITSLEPYFQNIEHAFLIGEAENQFAKTLENRVPYMRCQTLAHAFEAATEKAFADRKQGAVVLLSPACASWDQWKNFEERGDAFCSMAEKLLDKVVGGGRK